MNLTTLSESQLTNSSTLLGKLLETCPDYIPKVPDFWLQGNSFSNGRNTNEYFLHFHLCACKCLSSSYSYCISKVSLYSNNIHLFLCDFWHVLKVFNIKSRIGFEYFGFSFLICIERTWHHEKYKLTFVMRLVPEYITEEPLKAPFPVPF